MPKILSIDPGIKNLSFCYMSVTESIDILDWGNLCVTEENCKKISFEKLCECLLDTLGTRFDDAFEADIVLIENQPLNNNRMKSVSIVLYTYFNMMKMQFGNIGKIQFMKATDKLKCSKYQELSIGKDTYKDRKKASVELCKLYLKEICPERLEWLAGLKKADDISDTYLMIVYYIENTLKYKI